MTPLLSPHSYPRFSRRLHTLDVRTADLSWDPSHVSDRLIVLQPFSDIPSHDSPPEVSQNTVYLTYSPLLETSAV